MKIHGNTIISTGGSGMRVEGDVDADIRKNEIIASKIGIEVDETFKGTIAENHIQDTENVGILVKKINPYNYFEIPSQVSRQELLELFEKIDTNQMDQHKKIMEESVLSKFDKFTAISERINGFIKEYGPILVQHFSQYFNN